MALLEQREEELNKKGELEGSGQKHIESVTRGALLHACYCPSLLTKPSVTEYGGRSIRCSGLAGDL